MSSDKDTLDRIQVEIASLLADGVNSKGSDWRWATLVSKSCENSESPFARIVVLRAFDSDSFQCQFFTDARSPKVTQLAQNPACSLLFFDKSRMLQLRAEGTATLEKAEDGVLPEALVSVWRTLPDHGRADYLTLDAPGASLPDTGADGPSEIARIHDVRPDHFCRITVSLNRLDWLSLRRGGHLRAIFQRQNDQFIGQFVVP